MENKEGRVNYKFISSGLIFTILMALLVIGLVEFTDSVVRAPTDNYINLSRSINFTFNSTWTAAGGEIGNCSLWTDFTGTWAETAVNNSASANIMNGTTGMSNINYTFTGDATSMSWAIACRNGSSGDALNVTSSETWTLTIDTLTPKVNQTDAFFSGFNTSSLLPSITFYLNDINGSGINLTATAGAEQANETLNVTIYNYEAAGGSAIAGNFTLANSSFLSCTPTGGAVTETTCTLDLTNLPLTDGSKNISIAVSDRAGRVNLTSFLFTVDTLAPALTQLNITNASQFAGANVMDVRNGTGWIIQGATIYLTTNLTDNLTQPLNISFQFLNGSTWQVGDIQKTVDASDGAYSAAEGMWGNASYTIPTGHNIFEGRNVSFRAVYNDTLGNSNTSETLIVQVNDTTKPTVSINGTFAVNGTNITDTTPRISWAVVEGNPMASINISVDGTVTDSDGVDGCGKSAWYDTSIGDKNVELFRNGSFPISEAGACSGLTNGSHYIRVIAIDVWGNSETVFNNFTVQTGTPTISLSSLENGLSAVNGSNVTVATGINFTAVGGATTSILETFSWTSSCNTSTQTISASVSDFTAANLSFIYPFQNITSCANGEASRTVTITVADSAGNSKTEQYTFLVDGVGPSLTVTSPTDGSSSANNVSIILTGTDGTQKLSSFGYYLDAGILSGTFNSLNLSSSIGEAATSTTNTFSRNFTAGRHTIKFTVNDTLGNVVNGTDYTITVLGPLDFTALGFNSTDGANTTLAAYNINMSRVVLSNSSGDAMGDSIRTVTDQTLNLFMALNGTAKGVNVTIYFNASAANWDRYNFSIVQNHSTSMGHIENNWTATILDYIYINDSLSNFIPAASYYGKVRIPINASNVSGSSYTLGNVFEIWYFADETDLTTRTNDVEECEASFIPTNDLTPCWNNTNDLFVEVFVPSFSIVALVNSSGSSPSITVNTPSGNQTVSHFIPSITVSADATNSCYYRVNGSTSNTLMDKSGTVCTAGVISFKNLQTVKGYNITYNVTDEEGLTTTTVVNFNVSDNTASDSGTSISASVSTTTATVTISSVNESVNATVWYGTSVGTLTSSEIQTTFSASPSVSLTGLTASTMYHYNVTLRDYNGNTVRNGTFNFTTSAAAAAAAASSSSGSSGGGGAVGVTSNVGVSQAQVWASVSKGSSISLTVDKANLGVTEISIGEVSNDLTNVELKASSLKANPVSKAASEKVYQYLQINKKNIQDEDATGIKIKFRVTKAWLSENGLTQGEVGLWRYKDGEWNLLSTKVTSSDATYVNYEASTPGFSYFAIGTKESTIEELPAEEVIEDVTPTEEVKPVEKPTELPQPEQEKMPVAWIIFGAIIVIGLITYFVVVKKKK